MVDSSPPRTRPGTAEGAGFRFRAGRSSLDLCSTLLWRHRSPVELLRRPEDVSRWLVEAGLCPVGCVAGDADLRRARGLREVIYRLVRAQVEGTGLTGPDVARLNAAAAAAVRVPRLTTGGRVEWVADAPMPAAFAEVARDCIDLLTGPLAGRLHECAAPDCAFLFVDTSRAGKRRWCAMNRCGNRQRVRDHRARTGGLGRRAEDPA
ncbi:CGNR zinc finger domain-containing protein [Actinomadura sp. 9N215]|uniref:CGNR zinc finger domain-containing protein n=1 Tax=Actinomadura sp. 9N215 TaxID=3375150 RepID=UPI0037B07F7B